MGERDDGGQEQRGEVMWSQRREMRSDRVM